MSRRIRIGIILSWLVAAFLLVRMAWGGSLFGIVYVLEVTHPAVMVAGAVTVSGAIAVALLLALGSPAAGLRASIVLSFVAIPLSIVLVPDHYSAPVVGVAAVVALGLSARALLRPETETGPPGR